MPRTRVVRHVRGRGRQAKVWVPFEQTVLEFKTGAFNTETEVEGLIAAKDDIQVPYNFITAGNTAASQFGSVRAARACTILAISMSAIGQTPAPDTLWLGVGVSSGIVPTAGVGDLPALMASNAPRAWPYVSPSHIQAWNGTDLMLGFSTLQKGRRRLEPGDAIYHSCRSGSLTDKKITAQMRILFGVPE